MKGYFCWELNKCEILNSRNIEYTGFTKECDNYDLPLNLLPMIHLPLYLLPIIHISFSFWICQICLFKRNLDRKSILWSKVQSQGYSEFLQNLIAQIIFTARCNKNHTKNSFSLKYCLSPEYLEELDISELFKRLNYRSLGLTLMKVKPFCVWYNLSLSKVPGRNN